jgi:hypothetical protein
MITNPPIKIFWDLVALRLDDFGPIIDLHQRATKVIAERRLYLFSSCKQFLWQYK